MLSNNTFLVNNSVVQNVIQNDPEMSTPENKNSEEQTNKRKFIKILDSVFRYSRCTLWKGLSVSKKKYIVIRSINILSFFKRAEAHLFNVEGEKPYPLSYNTLLYWLPSMVRQLAHPGLSSTLNLNKMLWDALDQQTFACSFGLLRFKHVHDTKTFNWVAEEVSEKRIMGISCASPISHEMELVALCKDFREATCDFLEEKCAQLASDEERDLAQTLDEINQRILAVKAASSKRVEDLMKSTRETLHSKLGSEK